MNPLAALPASLREKNRKVIDANLVLRGSSVIGGRAADRACRALESWLNDQHAAAVLAGILAWAFHTYPPVLFRDGRPAVVVGKGPADYVGELIDGRTLVVEAKSKEGRLSLDEVTKSQRDHLAATRGLALLVYRRAPPRQPGTRKLSLVAPVTFAVPWHEVRWTKEHGARWGTIGPEECAGWEVDAKRCYLERFVTP